MRFSTTLRVGLWVGILALALPPASRASAQDPPQILSLTPVPDPPPRPPPTPQSFSRGYRYRDHHHWGQPQYAGGGYAGSTYAPSSRPSDPNWNASPTNYGAWRISIGVGPTGRSAIGAATADVHIRLGHFGLDLGLIGLLGGADNEGESRFGLLAPGTFYNFYGYINPQDEFQAFGIASVFFSIESQAGRGDRPGENRVLLHLGAALGAGMEWRLSHDFSMAFDARALIQHNAADGRPEFIEAGTGRQTNASFGAFVSGGFLLRM